MQVPFGLAHPWAHDEYEYQSVSNLEPCLWILKVCILYLTRYITNVSQKHRHLNRLDTIWALKRSRLASAPTDKEDAILGGSHCDPDD